MSRAAAGCVICLLSACWRGKEPAGPPPAPPPTKGASCDQVAQSSYDLVAKAQDEQLAARAEPLQAIVLRRCQADTWSMELRRCVAGATSVDDASTCEKLATQSQRDAFRHDLEVMIVSEDGQ